MKPDLSNFAQVDRTEKPGFFVSYLDRAANLQYMKEVQRQMIQQLRIGQGSHVLDVGCGPGDRVFELAEIVGSTGRATGMDLSETMVGESRKRAAEKKSNATFEVGSAFEIPFPDNTFDGTRAERIYVHLDEPAKALSEMTRVTKPGGRVVVFEMDAETMTVDAPDRATTRKVLNFLCDNFRSKGWVGRSLRRLYRANGLKDVSITPATLVLTDFEFTNGFWALERTAERAREAGLISAEAASAWGKSLHEAAKNDTFFCSLTAFIYAGTK